MRSTNEPRGISGVLVRKAKAILEDDAPQQANASSSMKPEKIRFSKNNQFTGIQSQRRFELHDHSKKTDSPALSISLDRLKSSLDQIETSRNALEGDKKTQNIIQETAKLQNRRILLNNEERDLRMLSVQPQKKTRNSTSGFSRRKVANI